MLLIEIKKWLLRHIMQGSFLVQKYQEISEGGDVIKAPEAIRSPKELTDGCQRIEVYTD